MNKVFGLLLVVVIAISAIPYARSLGVPTPPPGVAADRWIAMGDAAGFVVTGVVSDPKKGFKEGVSDQVKGYFVIHRGGSWSRIDNAPDEGIYHASLR